MTTAEKNARAEAVANTRPDVTRDIVCGIDIGGTRTKVGLVDLGTNEVLGTIVIDTDRTDETTFLGGMRRVVEILAAEHGRPRAVGVSIGSFVFSDGSIDGMSSMVPFLTHGYPMAERVGAFLALPCRVDNDARLIGLTEARVGEGRGFSRVLTLTLGTGLGVGLCEDGHPEGTDSRIHLAGHIRVRDGGGVCGLDDEACYCGLSGCFESTCSGTSLGKVVRARLGQDQTCETLFSRADAGDPEALIIVDWYLDMLARALNQYVYIYCPDIIVLGGGVARGLESRVDQIRSRMVAEVWEGQRTEIRTTRLREDSGVIGAASLFAR